MKMNGNRRLLDLQMHIRAFTTFFAFSFKLNLVSKTVVAFFKKINPERADLPRE